MIKALEPFYEPGLLYGIGTLGLGIIFRYLRFPDFTVLGSIMIGGVTTVYFTNLLGPWLGIVLGTASGGLLGLLTGILTSCLKIQAVLAGIISFTASFSAGFMLTSGGRIDLVERPDHLLKPIFAYDDIILESVLALTLCGLFAGFMNTKWGTLLLAMTSDKEFLQFRHRYQNKVFVLAIIFGNAIVSLVGGLYSVNERGANVQAHVDFLPFSLGGIFAANIMPLWAAKLLHKHELAETAATDPHSEDKPGRIIQALLKFLAAEGGTTASYFVLFLGYVLACLLFFLISSAVRSNAFAELNERLRIPAEWQYAVVAVLLTFFVWLSGSDRSTHDME